MLCLCVYVTSKALQGTLLLVRVCVFSPLVGATFDIIKMKPNSLHYDY